MHASRPIWREGLISRDEALMRIDPASLDQMLHPMLDPAASKELIATGLAASPGSIGRRRGCVHRR